MSIGVLDAINAYGRIGRPTSQSPAADVIPVSGPSSFGNILVDVVAGATGSLKAAEQATARQIAGKGDLIDVTTAMTAAEMAMDTVVAVRDRVISAYSDIIRMQI
jgi:flagellar hook-basal body complex protein FliE